MAFKRKKIKSKKTVGAKLKSTRLRKKLTLDNAEEETKVRLKYLQAIEADDWQKFPNKVYALGFIKQYARFLEMDEDETLKEFKQEFGEFKTVSIKKKKEKPIDSFVITPKLLIATISILAVIFIVGYIVFSARTIFRPPEIEIINPIAEAVSQKEITIEGKTAETAIVEINNQLVNVNEDGYFSQKVSLIEGVNNFEIKAKNRFGKENIETKKIFYTPQPLPMKTNINN